MYIYILFISLILKWTWFPGSWFHLCTKHIQEGSPRSIPYIYIYLCIYIYMYIFIYIFLKKHIEYIHI